jgi:Mg-chelatase subunit ChlD
MRRREPDIFGVSFIDLMAGALGAVLILFIVIPKVNVEQYEEMEQMRRMEARVSEFIEAVSQMKKEEGETLRRELLRLSREIRESVRKLAAENSRLKTENVKLSGRVDRLQKKVHEQVLEMKAVKKRARRQDIGFRFRGRDIVFLLDASGSMDEEHRLIQVKAGLRMLLSAMNRQYRVALVIFPAFDNLAVAEPLWKGMIPMDDENREKAFDRLARVGYEGGTPTRAALKYVLEYYPRATDIVLMTDGKPMRTRNSKKGDPPEDIDSLVWEVTRINGGKLAIHTMGVGSDFAPGRRSDAVRFLRDLARRNGGFYTGF